MHAIRGDGDLPSPPGIRDLAAFRRLADRVPDKRPGPSDEPLPIA